MEDQIVLSAIRARLSPLDAAKLPDEFYYQSIPLCLIDVIFSIGVKYKNVQNVIDAWCKSVVPSWTKYKTDGAVVYTIADFLASVDGFSGEALSDFAFGGNRQRTSSKSGILKADAVVFCATALLENGINNFEDIKDDTKVNKARAAFTQISGQKSGISFDYFLMLSGDENYVKADRMLRRFVASALGVDDVSPYRASTAVLAAYENLKSAFPNLSPRLLDYMIWNYQRSIKPRIQI